MKCLFCGQETNNPKFCSRSCAAKHNNRAFPKKERMKYFCKFCGNETRYRRVYCTDCDPTRPQDFSATPIAEIRSRARYQANAWIRKLARKAYFASDEPLCCCKCGYTKHFEICHVQPIQGFPPDIPMSVVNSPENLVALCPNCHWELDHSLLSL